MKKQILAICSMLIVISITVALSYFFYSGVNAQIPYAQPTTANVTIMGHVGYLIVNYTPIVFTPIPSGSDNGLQPGTRDNPKVARTDLRPNDKTFVRVSTNSSSNVNWCLYINGTDVNMTLNPIYQYIPINNISFNTSCNGSYSAPWPTKRLSYGMQEVCCGSNKIGPRNFTDIYFYIDIPAGWLNQTYDGALWFYANGTSTPAEDNSTWYGTRGSGAGQGNTSAIVRQYIEFSLGWVPIGFGTMTPGTTSNASVTPAPAGFPSNVTIGRATNIYVDLYVNGTNLVGISGAALTACAGSPAQMNATQITYANTTMGALDIVTAAFYKTLDWSRTGVKEGATTSNCLDTVTGPLNTNWCGNWYKNKGMSINGTVNPSDITSYWNITVPTQVLCGEPTPAGTFKGDISFKIVRAGRLPDVE
jgi:hypothetical protein